ncbi:MAG: hypothetical protein ACI814_001157 [Mariniblastus sp.]|jgi:hypothetical protein
MPDVRTVPRTSRALLFLTWAMLGGQAIGLALWPAESLDRGLAEKLPRSIQSDLIWSWEYAGSESLNPLSREMF